MTDRVPGAPGQYKAVITEAELQKMQAGEEFTIKMTRDDQPTTEGTPYSKAAVLPDELAQKLCPDIADPTPADAFAALLPLRGGSMTGPLTPEVIILTEGVNYGDTLPEPGTPGRLFFLKA